MAQQYQRATERFRCRGIDLNNPVDSVRPEYYPVIENVRSYTDGIVQPRQGLTAINTVIASKTPVHSVRRLNDPLNSTYARIVGVQDSLAYGTTAFTQATYNGGNVTYTTTPANAPLFLVPYRPDQAVVPFMYIATQAGHNIGSSFFRQLKINRSGTVHQMGCAAPTSAPTVELGGTSLTNGGALISNANLTAMTALGIAAGAATVDRVGAAVTITAVVYDSGTTGWCSICPSSMSDIGTGMNLFVGNFFTPVESVRVAEIYTASAATAVTAINYNSGTAGECVISPTISRPEMVKNAVVSLAGAYGTKYYRILSAIHGPDSTLSFKIDTGAVNVVVGDILQVVGSFRAYTAGTMIATDPVDSVARSATFTPTATANFGYFLYDTGGSIDLTRMPFGDGASSDTLFADDDYFHLSIYVDNWNSVTGGRIVFNVDPTQNPAYTGGPPEVPYSVSNNFYYRAFSPNDLIPESQNTQTPVNNTTIEKNRDIIEKRKENRRAARERRNFRDIEERPILDPDIPDEFNNGSGPLNPRSGTPPPIDLPPTVRDQAGLGNNGWSEIRFKKSDCVRVGNKTNGDWSAVRHIVFEFQTTATCAIRINSMTAWGGFKPDIGDLGDPYQYRFRYRVSSTGASSNWSPPSLNGVKLLRNQAKITTTAPVNSPEINRVDIQRLGGSLTNWTYIGTINASSGTFTDSYGDDDIVANAPFSEGDTNYQPWPVRGAPISGTTATSNTNSAGVSGTLVRDSGTNFNSLWAKGTSIIVNGVATTIRKVFGFGSSTTASLMEVDDNLGSQSAVTWEIPEPLVVSTPLPTLWTWEDRGFAVGDINNPGVLYYTNGNSLDNTQDTNWLEITSPSEPLMNGCAFNGKNYVWSTERMFELEQISQGQFIALEIPGRKGLASIYGVAVGERLWYVSRDGIYQSGGGDSISITDDTLKPLFVKEGNAGVAVNGFNPPDFTVPNSIRLSYYDGYLYFTYKDTSAAIRTLTFTPRSEKPGWWPDVYTPAITYFYGEEGNGVHSLLACGSDTTTGKLYQVLGTADRDAAGAAANISCHLRTQYFDAQDRRADKRWGDFIVDADTNNVTLNFISYTNSVTSSTLSVTPSTMSNLARGQQIMDISLGGDPAADYSRSMALDISWASQLTPMLYLWEPSYIIRPETADRRATQWDDCGHLGDKFFQGIELQADTFNVGLSVNVAYDGLSTNIADTLTVTHNGMVEKSYAFHPAFIAHEVRLHPQVANGWSLYNYRWIWCPEPPLADRWEGQQTALNADQFIHMKAAYITLRSNSTVTFTITRTDDNTTYTYAIATTGNARRKVYVPLDPIKGKAFIFVLTSASATPFRLYKDDTTLLVKPWGSEEAFANRNPFGDVHGGGRAEI